MVEINITYACGHVDTKYFADEKFLPESDQTDRLCPHCRAWQDALALATLENREPYLVRPYSEYDSYQAKFVCRKLDYFKRSRTIKFQIIKKILPDKTSETS